MGLFHDLIRIFKDTLDITSIRAVLNPFCQIHEVGMDFHVLRGIVVVRRHIRNG